VTIPRTIVLLLAVVALIASACTANPPESTTTTATTTTLPSTTQAPTTTTTLPIETVVVDGDVPAELAKALAAVMSWRVDQRNPEPAMPDAMAAPLLEMNLDLPKAVTVTARVAKLETGSVGIAVTAAGDVYAAADEGSGWEIVGASPAAGGGWFGGEPRIVLVLGSDARPGQLQPRFRADSIHLLTARASDGDGTILGFPRDSWIPTPFGTMKLSSVMAGRGPEVITDVMREEFEVPIEGYVVTGFKGFEQLMWDLGNLPIDLPRSVPNQEFYPGFRSGEQTLSPPRVLEYARTRKGVPGGDFGRSANHGVVMLAMLRLIQTNDVLAAPGFLAILGRHAWTDLTPISQIQLAATAFLLDLDAIENTVVPGRVGTAGGGSVVFLSDDVNDIVADLADDGLLTPAS
jgi:LCP family protein required for cell wall assembly